jgi:hypothetical protein
MHIFRLSNIFVGLKVVKLICSEQVGETPPWLENHNWLFLILGFTG